MRRRDLGLVLHGARADLPEVRHLVQWVREKGHTVRPRVTWEPGDGERYARELAHAGVDTVLACGGDGTANEVINGLDGLDTAFGLIPIGTANDFARQVGIPLLDVDHAMDVVLQREPRRIDTAELNGRRFLNVSTGGIGAEATVETPTEAKASLGTLAYAITGLRKFADLAAQPARFEAPSFALDAEVLVFAVGNGRATGGGTLLTPEARMTDGLLDVCVVEAMPHGDFARLALRLKRGEHLREDRVHYARVPWLTVRTQTPVAVNVDGEALEAAALHYRARPGDLRAHVRRLPEDEPEESERG